MNQLDLQQRHAVITAGRLQRVMDMSLNDLFYSCRAVVPGMRATY